MQENVWCVRKSLIAGPPSLLRQKFIAGLVWHKHHSVCFGTSSVDKLTRCIQVVAHEDDR